MSRASERARLARAFQAFGALVVLALVLGQLAVVGHYALVAHYVCSEHGTLHHGTAPSLAAHSRQAVPHSVSALSRDHHGSHDECSFPARRATQLARPGASELTLPTPRQVGSVSAATEAETDSSVPLYALAPKQSPPIG